MNQGTKEPRNQFIIFLFLFLLICFYYDIHQTIFYPPSSLHSWRQADAASITLNYYQNGFEFSNQKFHINGMGEGRKLTECPILYYTIAHLYSIFGVNDWVFRGTSLLIVFLGFFALSKLTFKIVGNNFISLLFPLIIFSSPTIAFYSPNFLPNMPAFGFVFIALYFIVKYFETNKLKFHFASMLFFLIAGLLKITAIVPAIAIFLFLVLEWMQSKRTQSKDFIFHSHLMPLVSFLIMFFGVFFWALGTSDLGPLEPIWNLDKEFIEMTFSWIYDYDIPYLLSTPTLILFLVLFMFILFSSKKIGGKIYLFNILILLGVISIFLLIFRPLYRHEYYFIEFLILPITTFLTFLFFVKKELPTLLNKSLLKFFMVLLLLFNINYTKQELEKRYDLNSDYFEGFNPEHLNPNLIRKFLESNGVKYPDSVISAPDGTPNLSLYIMNLNGWSEFAAPPSPIQFKNIYDLAQCCTKHLVIHDKKYLERDDLKPAFKNLVADYKNSIFLFDIQYLKEK